MEEDFRQYIIQHAKEITAKKMCEDDFFVKRLTVDILYGRSKHYGKNSRKNNGSVAGGLSFLEQEYRQSLNKEE